jgi:hypothetical protein
VAKPSSGPIAEPTIVELAGRERIGRAVPPVTEATTEPSRSLGAAVW